MCSLAPAVGAAASLTLADRASRRVRFNSKSACVKNNNAHRNRVGVVSTNAAMHGHGVEAAGGGAATTGAHGHGHGHGGGGARRPGENKGFVEEMRFVAMKLHTREQAPKEGEKKPEPEQKPMAQWQPTVEGYLRFLVESKAVYDAMEEIVSTGESPIYAAFVDTGKGDDGPGGGSVSRGMVGDTNQKKNKKNPGYPGTPSEKERERKRVTEKEREGECEKEREGDPWTQDWNAPLLWRRTSRG